MESHTTWASGAGIRVSRVRLPPHYSALPDKYWGSVMLLSVAIVAGVTVVFFRVGAGVFAGVIWCAIPVLGACWIGALRMRRKAAGQIREIIASHANADWSELFGQVARVPETFAARWQHGVIVGVSAANGRRGQVVLITHEKDLDVEFGRPLDFEFEPTRLNEADDAFRSLANEVVREGDAGDRSALAKIVKDSSPATLRGPTRLFRVMGGLVMISWLGWGLMYFLEFVQRRTLPSLPERILLVPIVAIGVIWYVRRAVRQCFLVPASVVVRRSSVFSKQWALHAFAAKESVLAIVFDQTFRLHVFVADKSRCEDFFATPVEVELLLRAWLSPLAPPELERLSDLA